MSQFTDGVLQGVDGHIRIELSNILFLESHGEVIATEIISKTDSGFHKVMAFRGRNGAPEVLSAGAYIVLSACFRHERL